MSRKAKTYTVAEVIKELTKDDSEQHTIRSKRQRKPNKIYSENYVINECRKTRRWSRQLCLSEVQNRQEGNSSDTDIQNALITQEYKSGYISEVSKNEKEAEAKTEQKDNPQQMHQTEEVFYEFDSITGDQTDVTPDVSLLLSSSTMEELSNQLTSSPISDRTTEYRQPTSSSLTETIVERDSELAKSENLDGPNSPSPLLTIAMETVREAHGEPVVPSCEERANSPSPLLTIPMETLREEVTELKQQPTKLVAIETEELKYQKTRKRKRIADQWKRNARKVKKLRGEAHVNTVGTSVPAKQALPVNCKCRWKCTEAFNDEVRSKICAEYYALGDFCRQKDYILQRVTVRPVKSRKVVSREPSGKETFSGTRDISIAYFLEYDGSRHRVCQSFFLKTLCVSNRAVQTAVDGKTFSGTFGKLDGRGRQPSVNKTEATKLDAVKDHIKSFPTVESHYCRKDTQRQYLDSKLTVSRMYELYREKCKDEFGDSYQPVSATMYRKVFNEEFNLGFYKPKKDQCAECSKFELMAASEKDQYREEFEQHQARNKEAQTAKASDKQRANDDRSFRSVTFDLQSVLQVPSSDASLMYYKRKLCCFNFTIYDQAEPNDGHCYLWSEVDGGRGSVEIGSCLLNYLRNTPNTVHEVSMFSDTCGGQNRNQNVAGVLLYAVQAIDHIHVIEQKFLEKGHTYMECDSMHSAIEFAKKNSSVFCVSAWKAIFECARRKNPYKVHQLSYSDFVDCKALCDQLIKNRSKNDRGETVNWLKIKVLRFEKNSHHIQYKYRYDDDFSTINVCGRGRPTVNNLPQLTTCYRSRLPITLAKKNDLLALCKSGVVPKEHHHFFKSLPSTKKDSDD